MAPLRRPAAVADLGQAITTGAWVEAVDFIDAHWVGLVFGSGPAALVRRVLHEAPEPVLRRSTKVSLMAEAVGRLPSHSTILDLPETREQIELAMCDGTLRTLVETSIHAMIARRACGHSDDAIAVVEATLPLLRVSSPHQLGPATDLVAYWHLEAGTTELHAGILAGAQRHLWLAWALRTEDATGQVAASVAPLLALLAALAGDSAELAHWHGVAGEVAAAGDHSGLERPGAVALLVDAADRCDLAAGTELADRLAADLAYDPLWAVTLWALVRHHLNAGEPEAARRLLATTLDLQHRISPGSLADGMVALAQSDIALAEGHTVVAKQAVERLLDSGLASFAPVQAARLRLALADTTGARRVAAAAERRAISPRQVREGLLLRAVAHAGEGERELALAALPLVDGAVPATLWRLVSLLPAPFGQALRDLVPEARLPAPNPGASAVDTRPVALTVTERRVLLRLTADPDGSLATIAADLYISRNTLKTHLRSIYGKLAVSSRDEAVEAARDLGLL